MANTIDKKSTYQAGYNTFSTIIAESAKVEKEEKKKTALEEKLEEMNNQIEFFKMQNKKNNAKSKVASNIASNFNPTMEMMKVASANSPSQVRRYISTVNVKIAALKKAGNYDTLIKRFRKIITKAEEKITNLEYEERIEKKAKDMERLAKTKESKKLREVKENHKRHRKLKEGQDVQNADTITFVPESNISTESVFASVSSTVLATADIYMSSEISVQADVGADCSVDISM